MKTNYFSKSLFKINGAIAKTIFFFILFLTANISFSQVSNYAFSQSTSTYEELSDATLVAAPTALTGSGSVDGQAYNLPDVIPFPFTFNDSEYTSLTVYADGYITFGSIQTPSSDKKPIASTNAYEGVISPMAVDLHALYEVNNLTGSISYEIVGESPNREFVIQWKHFRPYVFSNSPTSYWDWNFQIRLKEDNTISFVYDSKITGTPSSGLAQVGLRGTTNTDYTNRYSTGVTASNWTNSTAGTSNSNTMTTNSISFPSNGLTMTWTPPAPCTTPTTQPTNLVLNITGTTVNGSFTAATPAADKYIVIRTPAGTTTETPADGTTYTTGTGLNGNIISVGNTTSFVSSSLTGNTAYTYTVYSYNSVCSGGPFYNIENPLTEDVTSCPAPPTLPVSSNATVNSFTLNWTAPVGGNATPLHYEVEIATDNAFANQIAGSPFTVEATSTSFSAINLNNSTKYYYRIKAVSSCSSVYSSVGNISTLCQAVATLNENFDSATVPDIASCWSKVIRGTTVGTITTSSSTGNSAPNSVNLYNSSSNTNNAGVDVILVSPNLTTLSLGTYRLKFSAKKSASSDAKLQIGTLNSTDANAIFTEVGSEIELTGDYQQFTIYFPAITRPDTFIGFKRKGASTFTNLFIDDVIWEQSPSCIEPINLNVSAITPTSATVSWSAITAPANGFQYFVTNSNTPPTLSDQLISTNNTSINLTSLASGTYYVWVRNVCATNETSNWVTKTFTTIQAVPAPWQEIFTTTNVVPSGWSASEWKIGTERGVTGSNGAVSIYKNIYGTTPSGSFTTINVGPLPQNQELSFDYKHSAYSSPHGSIANWGNFKVQISTDFGTTWTDLATVTNEPGTGNYISKKYSLSSFSGNYVSIKIIGTRTTGDFDLSFDNFQIKEGVIIENPVASVNVTTLNNVPSTITNVAGTLQLVATANPTLANQNVTWSITSGSTFATVNQTGLVTALQNGTVTVKATSVENQMISGEIQVVISNQPLVFCVPNFPQGVEPITLVEFAGISNTTSPLTTSPAYENFTSMVGNVERGNTYPIRLKGNTNGSFAGYFKVYADWNNNGTFENEEGTDLSYIQSSTGVDEKELLGNISIPADAFIGNVRMRVLKKFASSTIPACNIDSYGQAEDYTLVVSEDLGTEDFSKNNFKVYPNPTTGISNIQSDLEIENIAIYNQIGQLISNQKNTAIDLSNVVSGIYIIQIDFENGQKATKKIIKK